MEKLPVNLNILKLHLKKYYQNKYPDYNVDFKCDINRHEGYVDWDGYVDY